MCHCLHCVTHLWDTDHLLETFSASVVSLQGGKETTGYIMAAFNVALLSYICIAGPG